MKLTAQQQMILYALSQFYQALNQPLVEKPLHLQTSKITFIEHLLHSNLVRIQERALYKNLEMLERQKLVQYEQHLILFTEKGLKELEKISKEINQYLKINDYFKAAEKPKRKLQTIIRISS